MSNFNKGEWWVQDFSSMLPLSISQKIKNLQILDLCAAPGGKAFQILSSNNVVLNDVSLKRISKLKDNLSRLKYNPEIQNLNGLDFDENLKSVATSLLYTDVSSKRVSYITLNQWFDESLLKDDSLHPIYFPSINKDNYELFMNDFKNTYGLDGDQLSFLSYDLIGLVYFLIYENDFKISKKIFYKKNKFKGKIGVFEISKNTITHQLNFYSIEDKKFKKIF